MSLRVALLLALVLSACEVEVPLGNRLPDGPWPTDASGFPDAAMSLDASGFPDAADSDAAPIDAGATLD